MFSGPQLEVMSSFSVLSYSEIKTTKGSGIYCRTYTDDSELLYATVSRREQQEALSPPNRFKRRFLSIRKLETRS